MNSSFGLRVAKPNTIAKKFAAVGVRDLTAIQDVTRDRGTVTDRINRIKTTCGCN